MDKSIFGYNPTIGCPFDNSDISIVDSSGNFEVGSKVKFRGSDRSGTLELPVVQGKIVAIGENAKLDGAPLVAFAVESPIGLCFKADNEIWHAP